jgi:hypothetical protein
MERNIFSLVFQTFIDHTTPKSQTTSALFVNHVRGPDKSVRRNGSDPQAVVWTALI